MKKRFLITMFATMVNIGLMFADFANPAYTHVKIGNLYYDLDWSNAEKNVHAACIVAEGEAPNNYANLTSVTIPYSISYAGDTWRVEEIGTKAFDGCSKLT